jgi:hypothetical protein
MESFELSVTVAKKYGFTFAPKSYDKNVHLSDIKSQTRQFVTTFGLKFNDHLSNLAGVTYPYHSATHLMVANYVAIILWLIDDYVDEDIVKVANPKPLQQKLDLLTACKNVCTNMEVEINPIISLLREIFNQIENATLQAFTKHQFAEYIDGVVQHLNLDPKNPLTLVEYFDIRRLDGGCEVVWPLCFLDETDFEPYMQLLESDLGKKIRYAANFNVAIVNDILSIKRDIERGDNFNAVLSYMHEHHVDQEQAIAAMVEMCNCYFDEISTASTKYESLTTDENVLRKISSKLAIWCQASLIWHIETERYRATLR